MKSNMNCSKPWPPPLEDTLSLNKILRLCAAGESFFTMTPDKNVITASRNVGCTVTTRRHEIRNLNVLEQITFVTVVTPVPEDRAPVFPRKPHKKREKK